ncbi:hypothetical protein OG978_06495 [Streptomyces sp. NBC_01591]|uniref:hypothetical protein n=1 Tax=Streptomyces sp. NBC_01591 TaxID=2975888 RepID=UPI002DDC73CF|nr:hypothetical protein [Streptomyces sp. NBC_01591]WSD67058.1 hypothetical protein OG978_06495 [Streptomyces sp. NBC_01591]
MTWTEEQRGKVYSTRARVNPDHLTEGLDRGPCWLAAVPPFDAARCFAEARDKSRHDAFSGWEYAGQQVEKGARHAAPSMAALGLRAAALYRSGERPDVLDLDVEVAMTGTRTSFCSRSSTRVTTASTSGTTTRSRTGWTAASPSWSSCAECSTAPGRRIRSPTGYDRDAAPCADRSSFPDRPRALPGPDLGPWAPSTWGFPYYVRRGHQ